MKSCLVTGANGYIGQHVIKYLLNKGYIVIASDFRFDNVDSRAKFCDEPIFSGEEDIYERLGKPDICIHLAWMNGFNHNASSHMEQLSKHIIFCNNMIKGGLPTLSVMGTMHEIGYWEGAITADTPCNPQSQYGIAKNAMRQSLILSTENSSCNFRWLRAYYNVSGDPRGNSIFSKLVQASQEGKKTFPFTTGKNLYDFLDLDELAKLICLASIHKEAKGIINVCSGKPESLASRVEKFIKENNLNISLEYGAFQDRKYDSPGVWGDASLINKLQEDWDKL